MHDTDKPFPPILLFAIFHNLLTTIGPDILSGVTISLRSLGSSNCTHFATVGTRRLASAHFYEDPEPLVLYCVYVCSLILPSLRLYIFNSFLGLKNTPILLPSSWGSLYSRTPTIISTELDSYSHTILNLRTFLQGRRVLKHILAAFVNLSMSTSQLSHSKLHLPGSFSNLILTILKRSKGQYGAAAGYF